jgi:hypothetical protein
LFQEESEKKKQGRWKKAAMRLGNEESACFLCGLIAQNLRQDEGSKPRNGDAFAYPADTVASSPSSPRLRLWDHVCEMWLSGKISEHLPNSSCS